MAVPKKKKSYSMKKKKHNINFFIKFNGDIDLKFRRWSDYYEYHNIVFRESKLAKRYSVQLINENEIKNY